MRRRNDTIAHRTSLSTAIAGAWAASAALMLAAAPVHADNHAPRTDIYGQDSRGYGGPNYEQLRPRPRGWSPGPAYGPDYGPAPSTDLYGRDSRAYGGPNYGGIRPGTPGYGYRPHPSWQRSHQGTGMGMGPQPRGGIYSEDSRHYGGPNYDQVRPDAGRSPGGRSTFDERSRQYGSADYAQTPSSRTAPDPSPRTSIFGDDGRQYGGPNYEGLKPDQSE